MDDMFGGRRSHSHQMSPDSYVLGGQTRGRTLHRSQHESGGLETNISKGRLPTTATRIMNAMRRSLSYGGPPKKRESSLAEVGMSSTAVESLPPSPPSFGLHESGATSPSIEQIAMGLHISRTPHLSPTQIHHNVRSRRRQTVDYSLGVNNLPSHPTLPSRPLTQLQHRRRDSAPAIVLPPPPTRSSMKKQSGLTSTTRSLSLSSPFPSPAPSTPLTASTSDVSLSSSTVTSTTAPSTPRSVRSSSSSSHSPSSLALFSTRLHMRMSKLLLPMRKNVSSSTVAGVGMTMVEEGDDDSSQTSSTSAELTPRKMVRFSQDAGVPEEEDTSN
ncbi:hypothetical protein ABKN59_010131 [Abortiporus biennis]